MRKQKPLRVNDIRISGLCIAGPARILLKNELNLYNL